jgi:hypothetical protein
VKVPVEKAVGWAVPNRQFREMPMEQAAGRAVQIGSFIKRPWNRPPKGQFYKMPIERAAGGPRQAREGQLKGAVS